jgi:magnesium-protoporphyrin IX monomethyl ester (oxidative) cyclase
MLDFLNKAMSDFDVSLDLGFLTKTRTHFCLKFIFTLHIFQKNWILALYCYLPPPRKESKFPCIIFRFFESWCQDENRHGDFFAAILKSQNRYLH